MSEDNKNLEEEIKEEIKEVKEEIQENEVNQVLEDIEEEKVEDKQPKNDEKHEVKTQKVVEHVKAGFFARLISSLIDQAACLVISVALLYVAEGILLGFGYYLMQVPELFFVIYAIVNVLYVAIIECTKLTRTLGKALLKI